MLLSFKKLVLLTNDGFHFLLLYAEAVDYAEPVGHDWAAEHDFAEVADYAEPVGYDWAAGYCEPAAEHDFAELADYAEPVEHD